MRREARRGYPKLIGDTRTPSDMGLGFYISYPLKMGWIWEYPNFIGLSLGRAKSASNPPCCHAYTENTQLKIFIFIFLKYFIFIKLNYLT
jgi:hypothetical protein